MKKKCFLFCGAASAKNSECGGLIMWVLCPSCAHQGSKQYRHAGDEPIAEPQLH